MLKDLNRRFGPVFYILSVMHYGSDARKQIFVNAPFHPQVAGHLQYGVDGRFVCCMNIIPPLYIIIIDPVAELRKKIEIEMIMRIDQSRKSDALVEIQMLY